jgi:GAF domain-containing protein
MNVSGGDEQNLSKKEERRQAFLKQVRDLAARIRAAADADETLSDMSRDLCYLFGCDRMTLYAVSPTRTAIQVVLKTGLNSIKNFALPIASTSVAGHTALTKRLLNIRNVYDREELQALSRELRFFDKVDQNTGYRAKEMLTAPILSAGNGELLGVIQLINNRLGGPFSPLIEEGVQELGKTFAVILELRLSKPDMAIQSRFDPLVTLGALSLPELALAKRSAHRKQLDLEDVLIDEFQVRPTDLGASFGEFFCVPYEPFRPDSPMPAPLRRFKRDYAESHGWLPVADNGKTVTVVSLDPDQLVAGHTIDELFPEREIDYRVTTRREFRQMVEQWFGPSAASESEREANSAVLERLHRIIGEALASAAPELRATMRPEFSKVARDGTAGKPGEARISITLDIKLP